MSVIKDSGEDVNKSLLYILSTLRIMAEATENSSLANQPLMLFHHGRVAAFKELEGLIKSLGQDAPPRP